MPKPFANTTGFNGAFLDTYLIAMQAGTATGDPGLDQMRKITLGQLRAYVRQGFGNMMNFRGAYASALPEDPQINDYFYASATFTVDEVTYTQYHFYEYNGLAWFDISGVLSQFCTLEQATEIVNSLALLKSQLEHTLSGDAGKIPASDAVNGAINAIILMNRQLVGSGITLAPNGVASDLFNITVPSGYNILTITLEPTQNYVVTGLAKHQSGYYYTVQNVYTGGDNSFDVYARVLFIKQ